MSVVIGVDILILVNTGDDVSPNWIPVGGQRGATMSDTVDTVETTHKLSGGAKTYEYTFSDATISCDGVYILNDEGYNALVGAMRQKQKVKVRWQEKGDDIYEGEFLVVSRDLEGAYDSESTYSMELQRTGDITVISP